MKDKFPFFTNRLEKNFQLFYDSWTQYLPISFFILSLIVLYSSIFYLNFLSPIYKFSTNLNCNFFDCFNRSSYGWLKCTFTFFSISWSYGFRFGFILNSNFDDCFMSDNCCICFTFFMLATDSDCVGFFLLNLSVVWPFIVNWKKL